MAERTPSPGEGQPDKPSVVRELLALLEADLDNATRAARTAHEAATHEESKAENKYDTRGLEASYLAAGQSRRVDDLRGAVASYRKLAVKPYDEVRGIQAGDLIMLESVEGLRQWFFLGPQGAGLRVQRERYSVTVITPRAPLGQELGGKREGDEVIVNVGGRRQSYEVVKIH